MIRVSEWSHRFEMHDFEKLDRKMQKAMQATVTQCAYESMS